MSFGECSLSAKDSLAHGLLGYQEGAGDLGCGEAADQTQRQRDATFNCKDWMARGKDESQDIIIDDLVERLIQCIGKMLLLEFEPSRNLSVFLFEHSSATQRVEGAALGRRHQPGTGIFRDTFDVPLLEGRDEHVLAEFFGDADVAGLRARFRR